MVHKAEKSKVQNPLERLCGGDVASSAALRRVSLLYIKKLMTAVICILCAYQTFSDDGWVFTYGKPTSGYHIPGPSNRYYSGRIEDGAVYSFGSEYNNFGSEKYATVRLCDGWGEVEVAHIKSEITFSVNDKTYTFKCPIFGIEWGDKGKVEWDLWTGTIEDYQERYFEKYGWYQEFGGGSPGFSADCPTKKIIFDDGIQTVPFSSFSKCRSIEYVRLPNNLKRIERLTFNECSALREVDMPDTIVYIGYGAFGGCTNLTSLTWPKNLRTIENEAFSYVWKGGGCGISSAILPDGLEHIGNSAFRYCHDLEEVYIPNTCTNIGKNAFAGCDNLSSVKLPDGIDIIPPGLFSGCKKLAYFHFQDSIMEISDNAFHGTGFRTVNIPSTIKTLGGGAFSYCTNMTDAVINSSNIGEGAFGDCFNLKSVTIGNNVTSIGSYAFEDCSGLTSVTIPDNVTSIGSYAFEDCSGLTSVVIGTGVVIGDSAFANCTCLTNITFGDNVELGTYYGVSFNCPATVHFKGRPPRLSMFSKSFPAGSIGFYDAKYRTEWESVIYNGYWLGLKMEEFGYKPQTYTIIYNVTEGEGSVASQTCEFGEEVYVDDGGTLHWEGHCFAGWALELDGDVAVKPGETVPPPTDGSKIVNLYAKWRPVMLAPLSADWQKGEITLMYGSMEAGMGMSVECRRGDDPSAIWNDIGKEVELSPVVDSHVTITDRNFSSRYDGIPPVEYRVKDTAGGEATCMTRTKYALAVAVSNFQDNWLKGHAYMTSYATKFATLAQEGGAKLIALLRDEDATLVKINEAFASLANMVQTGDVCLFYFGTHGGVYPGTTDTGLWLYQKEIYYSEENLANHIDSLAADWGVATVGIVHACHSGGLADNSNDTYCKGSWCVNSMLTSPNAAWITSTDSAEVSAYGDHFLEFLIGYGWEKGWAGSEGKALTFGSLADYMGRTYDELFSGVLVGDNPKVIKAGITNKQLLDRIAIGICAHHEAKPKPAAFSITPSTDDPNKVSLKTSEVSADKLSVFSRFVRTGRWTLWAPYDGGNRPALYRLDEDTTKKGEAANTRHSSENDKMEFIVKAYNGAGVTAAYNNPMQG